VLNGAEGVNDMLAKALTMGGTGLGLARNLLASMRQDAPADGAGLEPRDNHHAQQVPIG